MAGADDFLRTALADGRAQPAAELIDTARAVGISERQLRRARERLGVEAEQAGRRWHWSLPGVQAPSASTRQPMTHDPSMTDDPSMRRDPSMEAVDWEHVGAQVPPPGPVPVMEPRPAMEPHTPRQEPKRQAPHDEQPCSRCGRWTCPDCLHEIPAHRVAQHRAGVDPSRPECGRQDVRSIGLQREPRPRSLFEAIGGLA